MVTTLKFEKLKLRIEDLGSAPRVAARLLQLSRDPSHSTDEVVAAIEIDPATSVRVLTACNSVMNNRGEVATSVNEAVHRLGFNEVNRIAMLTAMRTSLGHTENVYSEDQNGIWERSILTACAMEELPSDEQDTAQSDNYTIGLLHSIGLFLIAHSTTSGGARLDAENESVLVEMELQRFGTSFPEAGADALEFWGFPKSITEPVRHQLDPDSAGEYAGSAHRLNLAMSIARAIQGSTNGLKGTTSFLQDVLLDPTGPMAPVIARVRTRVDILMAPYVKR